MFIISFAMSLGVYCILFERNLYLVQLTMIMEVDWLWSNVIYTENVWQFSLCVILHIIAKTILEVLKLHLQFYLSSSTYTSPYPTYEPLLDWRNEGRKKKNYSRCTLLFTLWMTFSLRIKIWPVMWKWIGKFKGYDGCHVERC